MAVLNTKVGGTDRVFGSGSVSADENSTDDAIIVDSGKGDAEAYLKILQANDTFDNSGSSAAEEFVTAPGTNLTVNAGATTAPFSTDAYVLLNPFDIAGGSYDSKSHSVSSQGTAARGVTFKTDGTKMYVTTNSNTDIFQYSLSPAWDVSTASYDTKTFSVTTEAPAVGSIRFKPDGTKIYVGDNSGDRVLQYSLSTAWDISSMSYDSKNLDTTAQDSLQSGFFIKDDGTKVFTVGTSTNTVYQYTMSTAWDMSTATYDSKSLSVSAQDITAQDVVLTPDGTTLFMLGDQGNDVNQYTLSTPFDLSTGSTDSTTISVGGQEAIPQGFEMKTTGDKMYVVGNNNNVYQYSIGAAFASPLLVICDANTLTLDGTETDLVVFVDADLPTNTSMTVKAGDGTLQTSAISIGTKTKFSLDIDITLLGSGTLDLEFSLISSVSTDTPRFRGWGTKMRR